MYGTTLYIIKLLLVGVRGYIFVYWKPNLFDIGKDM